MNPHGRDPHTKPLPAQENVVRLSDHRVQSDDRPVQISRKIAERALETPDQLNAVQSSLAEHLQQVQSDLAYLAGAVEPESLASAVVGAMGNAAEEIREQLRPLRSALRADQVDGAA